MRTCQGCDAAITPGYRERRKRLWCSGACRGRELYRTGRKRTIYFPRKTIGYATCVYCSKLFVTRRPARPSDRVCRAENCRKDRNAQASKELRAAWKAEGKPLWSQAVMDRRRAANSERRAKTRGAERIERFSNEEIFERDGWRCGVCGRKTSKKPWPHPKSATLDHLIPLSDGGEHTRANTRCAHLRCNSSRGNRGGDEQLRLIG